MTKYLALAGSFASSNQFSFAPRSLRVDYKTNVNPYATDKQEPIWINVSFLTFHYVFNEIPDELSISCDQMPYRKSATLAKKIS